MIAENSYAGEESDGCGDGVPEDSEQYDSSEESVWLQTPLLDRHVMRHSNYITGSRSGTSLILCTGSVPALTVAGFRQEVSGYTRRILLCKAHGISYAGGKAMHIRNMLDHYCEFHQWGDKELDAVVDLFSPHDFY